MRVLGINALLLGQLVATVDGYPSLSSIVVADDRRDATSALTVPATTAPLVVVRTNGRGPAAAQNAGWRTGGFDERFPRAFREDADSVCVPPERGTPSCGASGSRPTRSPRQAVGAAA
jgi:hypothetical protein